MPTGYTDPIYSTVHHPDKQPKVPSFEEFVLRCARAFGAFVEMRDMSLDAELPEVLEEHSYYYDALAKAYRRRAEVGSWTQAVATSKARAAYKEEVKHNEDAISKAKLLKERYEAMLDQVKAWEPPSEDHEGLKAFMIEQLESSIKFDCNAEFWEDRPAKLLSGADYKQQEFERASRDIEYYQKERIEEANRVKGRNEWIALLHASLSGVKA